MKTESILLQTLCVPCACRCRYCLLSWDGRPVGADWERSTAFALGFRKWMAKNRPELQFQFSFGFAMDHPNLPGALGFIREIGSPQAEFLQCDGLKMRSRPECEALARTLSAEGVRQLNFTFYGLPEYHDRFAGRRGDFDLMLRLAEAALASGLEISAGIPLTRESAPQINDLIRLLRERTGFGHIFLFVPHEEGRGVTLSPIRFSEEDLCKIAPENQSLLNRRLFRPEREWVKSLDFTEETRRTLILSLRQDNIDRYEAMSPGELIAEAETLDDAYYAAFPTLPELAQRYGDRESQRFYRQRDLFAHYRKLYAAEFGVSVYDVTDERQTGSRRY